MIHQLHNTLPLSVAAGHSTLWWGRGMLQDNLRLSDTLAESNGFFGLVPLLNSAY